ncbi:hypothetical protein [Treponema sp.]|uniref:hypothetical protein n=1 Tax=Treponema sp. TaxID=166 RepID=UPI003FD74FB9
MTNEDKKYFQKYIDNVKKASIQLSNAVQNLTLVLSDRGYDYEASITSSGEVTFWRKGNELDEIYRLEDLTNDK